MALAHRRPLAGTLTTGRVLLAGVCMAQLVITASFLTYIHASHRAIQGDYGMPYAAQVEHSSGIPQPVPPGTTTAAVTATARQK